MTMQKNLRILHQSANYVVIDKPFDVILNSDDADRDSVHARMKSQFPELVNTKLKVIQEQQT